MRTVQIANFEMGDGHPLVAIAGPCVIESADLCLKVAERLAALCSELGISYLFKASFDKANRQSLGSYRGPGLHEGLRILERVRQEIGVPIYTDVHTPEQARTAAEVCDALQVPAFLCRQTDLVVAAAKTGRPVSIKKGQFMAPWDMGEIVKKAYQSGNEQIWVIDRGASFGYQNLVSDMRAIPILKDVCGCPVCFDATHSVQLPGAGGSQSGGQRQFIFPLARAAVAAGAHSLFFECHPDPACAKCDAATQLPLEQAADLLYQAKTLHTTVSEFDLCLVNH